MAKFGEGLSSKQIALCRAIEREGIASYSKAVKELQRKLQGRESQFDDFVKQLRKE